MQLIVSGHSVSITVRSGCLSIKDQHGERRIERVPRLYDRMVINGNIGMLTLDAQAWMHEYGLTWCYLRRVKDDDENYVTEDLISHSGGSGTADPELWRAQILGDPFPVMRMLLAAKLDGQAANAELLRDSDAAKRIHRCAEGLSLASAHREVLGFEGKAAEVYWQVWGSQVRVPFLADELVRVPPRWLEWGSRKSLVMSRSNRNATSPLNALLNYAYKVGESVCVEACHAVGMTPLLGLSHNQRHQRRRTGTTPRPSMALDLLEAIRPSCDLVVLGLLDYGQGIVPYLMWRDFLELSSGVVRVESVSLREAVIRGCEPLRDVACGYAREVARLLAG